MARLGLGLLLFLTLPEKSYLWIAYLSWGGLTFLLLRDLRYALPTIFFFTSFFHDPGLIPIPFFTLKHYHIAIALVAIIQIFRGEFFKNWVAGFQKSRLLIPIGAILLISIISALATGAPSKAYFTVGNLSLVLLTAIYVLGLFSTQPVSMSRCLGFFVFGVAVNLVIGFINRHTTYDIFYLILFTNRHLGMDTGFGIFYMLALLFSEKKLKKKALYILVTAFVLTGCVATGSRTIFYCLLIGFGSFCFLLLKNVGNKELKQKYFKFMLILVAIFTPPVIWILSSNKYIWARVRDLFIIVKPSTWIHAFNDTQNFGFLGYSRLKQLYATGDILSQHPFFGVGLRQSVTDFHCLYYTVLAGSGIIGFLIFAIFWRNLLRNLLDSFKKKDGAEHLLYRISAFSGLLAWVVCSFMESLFLQFSVWMNVVVALALLHRQKNESAPQKS